jgi:protein SCO1
MALARLAVAAGLLVLAGAAAGQAERVRREVAAVATVERPGAEVPRSSRFTEADGSAVTLAALAGRPALLTFNYARCERLCGLQLSRLARTLRDLGWDGGRFAVATVSIDPRDGPEALRPLKERLVREAGGGPGVAHGWRFITGAPADVATLAAAVGFRSRYDASRDAFAHEPVAIVLGADGRVSGYLHGISVTPAALGAALALAEAGRTAPAAGPGGLGGALLACMGLDPRDPAPLALRIMRASGAGALALAAGFVGLQAARGARRRARGEARRAG